jgi:hypothetical protein
MFEMREVRDRLVAEGHEVTAQWIDGKEKSDAAATEETMIAGALMDIADVQRADVLLAFSQERGTLHTGGGRHVEFGIALSIGVPIIVVGPRGEHIFHYTPCVEHRATLDEAIDALRLMTP